jgi:hypothetical protein
MSGRAPRAAWGAPPGGPWIPRSFAPRARGPGGGVQGAARGVWGRPHRPPRDRHGARPSRDPLARSPPHPPLPPRAQARSPLGGAGFWDLVAIDIPSRGRGAPSGLGSLSCCRGPPPASQLRPTRGIASWPGPRGSNAGQSRKGGAKRRAWGNAGARQGAVGKPRGIWGPVSWCWGQHLCPSGARVRHIKRWHAWTVLPSLVAISRCAGPARCCPCPCCRAAPGACPRPPPTPTMRRRWGGVEIGGACARVFREAGASGALGCGCK